MSLLNALWNADIPEPPRWMRPLFTLYVAGFAIVYPVAFLATLHFIFLGPGLGDNFTMQHLSDLLNQTLKWSDSHGTRLPYMALLALLAANMGFRGWIVFRGYADHAKALGSEVPMREIVTYGLVNLLNLLFVPALLLGLAGLASLLGHDPLPVLHGIQVLASMAGQLVDQVPTLLPLPDWAALLATFLVWTFTHYWLHRLSHTRRFLWLILHRPHHMPPHLTYATALPVFMSFPFSLLLVVPYMTLFGALSKLFSPQPLYLAIVLIHLITYIGEIFGHSPAVYSRYIHQRWARWISQFYGQGLYHVLHHSAEPDCERVSNNNTVNIGPGFFYVWDRLFGTYKPLTPEAPHIGLHGSPELIQNPLRLLLAGIAQILFELRHNRDMATRLKILLGRSDWQPPITRDFALKT